MKTLAILPVKRFALAKQRLSDRFDAEQRESIVAAMVGDVLAALASSRRLSGVLVISNEPLAAPIAERVGARLTADTREAGQSAAAALGVAQAVREGFDRVLLVPGDCPALERDELDALLDDHGTAAVVIVPDRHGTGTNALLLAPPDAIAPAFGPGSFARHSALAAAAGVEFAVARPATLLLDVDTPADLAALLAGPRERAQRTRTAFAAAMAVR